MQHNPQRAELIEAIHQSNLRLSLVLTGGGAGLISELLAIPGASQTILEANVPYSKEALASFLGRSPESYCAADTSQMLAVQAYFNSLPTFGSDVTAIGGTASLVTSSPKRGEHRFFKSIQTASQTTLIQATLDKNKRTRPEEESLLVELGLAEIGKLIGFDYEPFGLTAEDQTARSTINVTPEWSEVFLGSKLFCHANLGSQDPPRGVGILAGSFNPLHSGHMEMAESFEKIIGAPVHFELAIRNADKPPIDFLTIRERVNQFDDESVWLTNSPTFVEKSRIFPGNVFVVGIDTIERIASARFYPGPDGLPEAIDELRENQAKFLVFGRYDGKRFVTLDDLGIVPELRGLCEEISEKEFRNDISSTLIRKFGSGGFPYSLEDRNSPQ